MELHHGPPAVHVPIEVGQVGVVIHGLVKGVVAEALGKLLGEGGLSRPDDSGNSDEHDSVDPTARKNSVKLGVGERAGYFGMVIFTAQRLSH